MEKTWSREYVAYSKAHGNTPEKQIEKDDAAWPGGIMCGFILWMSEAISQFKKEHPECFIGDVILDHEKKIEFLNTCKHIITTK